MLRQLLLFLLFTSVIVGATWFFGFLVTGCNWRASWRYLKVWLAVVGSLAAAGILLALIFSPFR